MTRSLAPAAPAAPTSSALDALRADINARPTDPGHLQRLQPLLLDPETNRPAAALLADWSSRQGLPEPLRGLLAFFTAFAARHDAAHFSPTALGVDPDAFDQAVIDPGLAHHLHHAVHGVELARKLQQGVPLRDAPKFIVAIQKSGSSLLADLLAALTKLDRGLPIDHPSTFRGYPAHWSLGRGHDWDLRADIGADPMFSTQPGAIYKGHIPPSQKNFRILEIYGTSRYLICVRDPRDQAVANFCQLLRRDRNRGKRTAPLTEAETHTRLDAYLRSGAVLESLLFVGKWLAERHTERSAVVTYEGLMSEPAATLRRIADLYEMDHDDQTLARVWRTISPTTDRRVGADRTASDRLIYPLGWTGEIGVHETYFSEQNVETFRRVFEGFESATPWAEPIRSLYPSL